MMVVKLRKKVEQALARGYCHEKNKNKELDADLIESMADEVILTLEGVYD